MASVGPEVRISEKRDAYSLRSVPTTRFALCHPSTILRYVAERCGGRTYCWPSLIAAAIQTELDFLHDNGICFDFAAQLVCIGSKVGWQVGPLSTSASIGRLLSRCCGRKNAKAKSLVLKPKRQNCVKFTASGL
jgi:hypothetical protein